MDNKEIKDLIKEETQKYMDRIAEITKDCKLEKVYSSIWVYPAGENGTQNKANYFDVEVRI